MPSPALTEYSPAIDLLLFGVDPQTEYVLMSILAICMLKFRVKETTQTGRLYEMEQSWHTVGLRTWDMTDLTDEHWNSTHGYEPILQYMTDGWVVGRA